MPNPVLDPRWANPNQVYTALWYDLQSGVGNNDVAPPGQGGPAVGAAASRILKFTNNGAPLFDIDLSGNLYVNGVLQGFPTLPVAIAQGGTGQTTAGAAFDALAPTTTRGDLIARGNAGNVRVPLGGANLPLISNGTDAVFPTAGAQANAVFDALAPTTTRGDLIARGATGNVAIPIAGSSGFHWQSNGTDPGWAAFAQGGTGAVNRSWLAKAQERITPYDFGAVGDGVADDTTAMQNAVARAIAVGVPLYIWGTFKITATVNITGAIYIQGAGQALATFKPAQNVTLFNVTATAPCFFSDFAVVGTNTNTIGSGFFVSPASGENQNSKFTRLYFQNMWTAFDFEKASTWTMHDCILFAMQAQFVVVRNTNNVDSGDSSISDCIFSTAGSPTANQIGVYQESSGGLKITNSKFNNCSIGYQLNVPGGSVNTQDLLISNCSFEGWNVAGILLTVNGTATAGQWRNVEIIGNQFAVGGAASIVAIQIAGNTVATWLLDVAIIGNTININNTNCVGIKCDWCDNVTVANNVIENALSSAGVVGINFTANLIGGMISHNNFRMNGAGQTIFCASTTTIIDDPFGMTFSQLGTNITGVQNGSRIFVSDGAPGSSPLTGSSTGSTAFRQNGAWKGF